MAADGRHNCTDMAADGRQIVQTWRLLYTSTPSLQRSKEPAEADVSSIADSVNTGRHSQSLWLILKPKHTTLFLPLQRHHLTIMLCYFNARCSAEQRCLAIFYIN
jgi:hypothetical protein